MKAKDEVIVRYLIENKNTEQNILKISKQIGMDYKNAYSIVKRLEKMRLVSLETFGRSNRVKLINAIHPLIFEAEYNRRKTLLKNKNLAVLLNEIQKALPACHILLVFGSYAKRTQTKNSDIDLMFIVPDGNLDLFERKVHLVVRSLPLPIHYLVFSETQFIQMIQAREANVGQEAAKNNVILHGIEIYYETIK